MNTVTGQVTATDEQNRPRRDKVSVHSEPRQCSDALGYCGLRVTKA